MSRMLEERVLASHPLSPAYRMVLFVVAREVPEGQTEAIINRAALGRSLDASAEIVRHAFVAGEQINLCRLLKNGRVAFTAYDGLIGIEPPRVTVSRAGSAVKIVPPLDAPQPATPRMHLTTQQFLFEFARQWSAKYGQKFYPCNRDWKLAKEIAAKLPATDAPRYIANYLNHGHQFYRDCMHAFTKFADNLNSFCVAAVPEPKTRVPDAEATERYLQRMRSGGRA